ncbi:MAG: Holliday junction branch migration protein RuvA [Gudongella sp.]|jgi:Holliday junction DNA helicase RuvA|nr:Holliday junction branch migration protein RuvA [Gudongella sp.]
MIDYIIGKVTYLGNDFFYLENNGMGYKINTSTFTLASLSKEENIYIHTNLIVREDGLFLYGFNSEDEVNMFKLLLNVSKIGPKVACGILSVLRPYQIEKAIMTKDTFTLCKSPGVGKKTAERMVLELKDKIEGMFRIQDDIDEELPNSYEEAIQALISLGYSRYEVEKAFIGINLEDSSIQQIIKLGLMKLSR